MYKSKPIKNQNEYHEVMSKVTKEAVRVLKISEHQARLKIHAQDLVFGRTTVRHGKVQRKRNG